MSDRTEKPTEPDPALVATLVKYIEGGGKGMLEHAQAFASLVALAERSSVLDVNLGQSHYAASGRKRWCCTLGFNSGDLLDAVADSPEAAVKAVEAKMQEREDIQSGLMEDT